MTREHLHFIPCVYRPQAASLVAACGNNFVALGVERYLGDLILVSLQERDACTGEDVIYTRDSVCRGSCELVPGAVEARVEDLIVVPAEGFYALAATHIPEFAGAIDTSRQAVISGKVELPAGELPCVPL